MKKSLLSTLTGAAVSAFLIFQAIVPIGSTWASASEVANPSGVYQFKSHAAVSDNSILNSNNIIEDSDGNVYYITKTQRERGVCKIVNQGTPICVNIAKETSQLPLSDNERGGLYTDNEGNLFATWTAPRMRNAMLAVQLKTSDLSVVNQWFYASSSSRTPGLLTNFDQDIAYRDGSKLYYGILSSASPLGTGGPLYLLSSDINGSTNSYIKLPCPNGKDTCPLVNPLHGETIALPNGEHIISLFIADDTSSTWKDYFVIMNKDKVVATKTVDLNNSDSFGSYEVLNSAGQLVVANGLNQIEYFDLENGTGFNLVKTIHLPLQAQGKLTADGYGNIYVSGKIKNTDLDEVVYKVDKDYNYQEIKFPETYGIFLPVATPDGCQYFTAGKSFKRHTDLYRYCGGESAQLVDTFDFTQVIQTKVVYQKNVLNPDIYIFSHKTSLVKMDFNDYSVLSFKKYNK